MHLPDGILQNATCPVTLTIGAGGMALAAYAALKSEDKPTLGKFAATTSMLFAAQMVNITVLPGVSAHLIGGIAAIALLGLPFGVLSLGLLVAIQALVFGDGGIMAYGANVLNMALVGSVLPYLAWKRISSRNSAPVMALLAAVGVLLATTALAVELGISGHLTAASLATLFKVHTAFALLEAGITAALVYALASRTATMESPALHWSLALTLIVIAPFKSAQPDGLEYTGSLFGFAERALPSWSLIGDYAWGSMPALAVMLSGLMGALLIVAASAAVKKASNLLPE